MKKLITGLIACIAMALAPAGAATFSVTEITEDASSVTLRGTVDFTDYDGGAVRFLDIATDELIGLSLSAGGAYQFLGILGPNTNLFGSGATFDFESLDLRVGGHLTQETDDNFLFLSGAGFSFLSDVLIASFVLDGGAIDPSVLGVETLTVSARLFGADPTGDVGVAPAPIPLPASALLFLCGLLGLSPSAVHLRRRPEA